MKIVGDRLPSGYDLFLILFNGEYNRKYTFYLYL